MIQKKKKQKKQKKQKYQKERNKNDVIDRIISKERKTISINGHEWRQLIINTIQIHNGAIEIMKEARVITKFYVIKYNELEMDQ